MIWIHRCVWCPNEATVEYEDEQNAATVPLPAQWWRVEVPWDGYSVAVCSSACMTAWVLKRAAA